MMRANDITGIDEITKAMAHRIARKAKSIPKTEIERIKRLQKERAESKDKSPAQRYQPNPQLPGDWPPVASVPMVTMEDDEPTRRWARSGSFSSKTDAFVQKQENAARVTRSTPTQPDENVMIAEVTRSPGVVTDRPIAARDAPRQRKTVRPNRVSRSQLLERLNQERRPVAVAPPKEAARSIVRNTKTPLG
jgi:hypothetical protein